MIVQILIVNTAFYIYGNIRLEEISILNSFEQIQENILAGSAFSARLGSSAVAFIPDQMETTTFCHPIETRLLCVKDREVSNDVLLYDAVFKKVYSQQKYTDK